MPTLEWGRHTGAGWGPQTWAPTPSAAINPWIAEELRWSPVPGHHCLQYNAGGGAMEGQPRFEHGGGVWGRQTLTLLCPWPTQPQLLLLEKCSTYAGAQPSFLLTVSVTSMNFNQKNAGGPKVENTPFYCAPPFYWDGRGLTFGLGFPPFLEFVAKLGSTLVVPRL